MFRLSERPAPFWLFLVLPVLLCECRNNRVEPDNKVRIGWAAVAGSLPLFIASDQKFFEQHSVVPETIAFNNSDEMVDALVGGHIDIIPAISLVPIAHLELKGPGLVRVFAVSLSTPAHASDSLIAKSDSHFAKVLDLAGSRIGVFPGSSASNLLRIFLTRRGVDTKHISFVNLAPSLQMASLDSGAIDALFAYEPLTTIALESGRYRILHGSVYASLLNPAPFGGAVISRSFERKNPSLSARTISAFDDAAKFIRLHPEDARKLLPHFLGTKPEISKKIVIVVSGLSTEMDPTNLQNLFDLLYDAGELNQRIHALDISSKEKPQN